MDRNGNTTNLYYELTVPIINAETGLPVNTSVLTKVVDPSGRELNFQWANVTGNPNNQQWRVVSVTGPAGQQVDYAYDTIGLGVTDYYLTAVTVHVGSNDTRTTEFTYYTANAEGNDTDTDYRKSTDVVVNSGRDSRST